VGDVGGWKLVGANGLAEGTRKRRRFVVEIEAALAVGLEEPGT